MSLCSSLKFTIDSQADANKLASCPTFNGIIFVSSNVSGIISIDGPKSIYGLVCEQGAGPTTIQSSSIQSAGFITLFNLTMFSELIMEKLASVELIDWAHLPTFSEFRFASGATSLHKADIYIADTSLSTLHGIDPAMVSDMRVYNNSKLEVFNSQLVSVSDSIIFQNNSNTLTLNFPNLTSAAMMEFSNLSSLSIPVLKNTSSSLTISGYANSTFSAPLLESLEDFYLGDSPDLAKLDLPLLEDVSDSLWIYNNPNLQTIAFPSLRTAGFIEFAGGKFST